MVTHACNTCRVKPQQPRGGRYVPRGVFLQNMVGRGYRWECETCERPATYRAASTIQRNWRRRQTLRNTAASRITRLLRNNVVRRRSNRRTTSAPRIRGQYTGQLQLGYGNPQRRRPIGTRRPNYQAARGIQNAVARRANQRVFAAYNIQTAWRNRRRAAALTSKNRSNDVIMTNAATALQSAVRTKRAVNQLKKYKRAATTVQATARQLVAKRQAERRRQQQNNRRFPPAPYPPIAPYGPMDVDNNLRRARETPTPRRAKRQREGTLQRNTEPERVLTRQISARHLEYIPVPFAGERRNNRLKPPNNP